MTQKTAWFVLHRIREAFEQPLLTFNNPVEIDETYVGGKEKNKHKNKRVKGTQGRSTKIKTPVLGILERDGDVYALPMRKANSETIRAIVTQTVATGTTVYTDKYKPYKTLEQSWNRRVVNHSAGEYVNGDISTNHRENF